MERIHCRRTTLRFVASCTVCTPTRQAMALNSTCPLLSSTAYCNSHDSWPQHQTSVSGGGLQREGSISPSSSDWEDSFFFFAPQVGAPQVGAPQVGGQKHLLMLYLRESRKFHSHGNIKAITPPLLIFSWDMKLPQKQVCGNQAI